MEARAFEPVWVVRTKGVDHAFEVEVPVPPAIVEVLHVEFSVVVVGRQEGVVVSIEFEDGDAGALGETAVEGGGGLQPFPVQPEDGVSVVDEDVGLDGGAEFLATEVIGDVGKAKQRGDARRA